MIIDALASFVPLGTNLSIVAGAGVSIASTNTPDLLGQGVGTAPQNIIGLPSSGLFGEDTGIGYIRPFIQVNIGTAATTGNSATLNVAFQGAPDTAGTFQPGTWQTYGETGALTAAQLTAGQIIRLDWSPVFPVSARPRYLRLLFQVPSATNFTAGTVSSAIVTFARDDYAIKYASKNYSVA
jgi:hypothetical protein